MCAQKVLPPNGLRATTEAIFLIIFFWFGCFVGEKDDPKTKNVQVAEMMI